MMTRREFIKVAGAGVLAVSCAGMLSGCDVVDSIKEELEDQGAAKATISNVTFMMETVNLQVGMGGGCVRYDTLFHIRNKTSHDVSIPKTYITGEIYDLEGKMFEMEYVGNDIEVEKDSGKVEIEDFALKTKREVGDSSLAELKYKKIIVTIRYNEKKAIFTIDKDEENIKPEVKS